MTQAWGVPSGSAAGKFARAPRTTRTRMALTALSLLGLLALGACGGSVAVDSGPERATLAGATDRSPETSPTSDSDAVVIDPGPGESPAPTPVG